MIFEILQFCEEECSYVVHKIIVFPSNPFLTVTRGFQDLKRSIIDDGVTMVVSNIIIPHSGWDPSSSSGETCWSTVFRNASGVLRNVSSAGEYARKNLRECEGLVDALLYVVRSAIEKSNIGNKIVENCVCILRNLSYRCQEVEDPNYDKHPIQSTVQNRVTAPAKGEPARLQ